MALKIIADLCTACGDCEPECPTASIKPKKGVYFINPDSCTECDGEFDSPQCLSACPAGDACIVYL